MALTAKLALAAAALGVGLLFVWPEHEPASDAPLARSDVPADEGAPRALAKQGPPSATRSEVAPTSNDAPRPGSSDTVAAAPALDLDAEREAEVPPGAIAGLVVRGTIPLDGGHVDFQSGNHRPLPSDHSHRLARVAQGTLTRIAIGRDGRFSLTDLTDGWHSDNRMFTIGVDTTETRNLPRGAYGGPTVQYYVQVFKDRPGKQLVIVLGAASIVGHVYNAEGQPVVGAVVALNRFGSYQQPTAKSYAETDDTGRYRFHDLRPVAYNITLKSVPGETVVGYNSQQLARLGDEETRVFDFGAPYRAVTWRGRVLHPDGSPVQRPGTFGCDSRDVARYEEVIVPSLGAFELRLRPGRYGMRVRVSTADVHGTDLLPLGEIEVLDADFERDLTLPGTSVRGRVTGVPLENLPPNLSLGIYTLDRQHIVQAATVESDGTFVFCALAPGEYRVGPGSITAPGTVFVVREGDGVLTLDVPTSPR